MNNTHSFMQEPEAARGQITAIRKAQTQEHFIYHFRSTGESGFARHERVAAARNG